MNDGLTLQHQAITLWLDPNASLLRGEALLEMVSTAPRDALTLTARGLRLTRADLHLDGAPIALRVPPEGETLTLRAPAPLPAGPLRLSLAWTSTVTCEGLGLCRFSVGGKAYASSCLRADDGGGAGAPGLFASLASPALRTSIALTVYAPVGVSVIANARLLERRGVKSGACWRFAATPPIPVQAAGVAIGPFTITEGPGDTPKIRVLSPGAAAVAPRARATIRAVLEAIEARCGVAFPYDTLALVGVGQPGDAEASAGLVPVPVAVLSAGDASLGPRLARALARIWIGTLVSLPTAPVFEAGLALWLAHQVRAPDRMTLERPLDRPAEADADAQAAMIAQALAALEAYAPRALADALPRFLRRHAHQAASVDDLRACLDPATATLLPTAASAQTVHVETIAPTRVRLICEGWAATPTPLHLRIGEGARIRTLRVLLNAEVVEVDLPWPPTWMHPNAGALAPVRWRLPPPALRALVAHVDRLTEPERAALPGQIWGHLVADRLSAGETLDALLGVAHGPDLSAVTTAVFRLRLLARRLVSETHRPALARIVAQALAPAWARVGLWPRRDDTPVAAALRPWLIEAMLEARMPGVAGEIVAQADRTLAGLGSDGRDVERAAIALPWAAHVAGEARYFDAIDRALAGSLAPALRPALIAALGHFAEPTLIARGLDRALGYGLHRREWGALMRPIAHRREGRDQLRALLERRFEQLVQHLSAPLLLRLPELGHDARTASERSAWATTFAAPRLRLPGMLDAVARMLDTIDANIRLAAQASASLRARLAQVPPGAR